MNHLAELDEQLRLALDSSRGSGPSPQSPTRARTAPDERNASSTAHQLRQQTSTSTHSLSQPSAQAAMASTSSSASSLTYLSRTSSRASTSADGPASVDSPTDPFKLSPVRPETTTAQASPLPPRLSVETSSSSQTPSTAPFPSESLPTYEALAASEGATNPRFGRWGGWIEKRARETAHINAHKRKNLNSSAGGRGWGEGVDSLGRAPSERHSLAEKRLIEAGAVQAGMISPIAEEEKGKTREPPPLPPRSAGRSSQGSGPAPGRHALTASVGLEEVGSRFARHFAEKPLCAVTLPVGGDNQAKERFVLVGTANGLHLADLSPALSTAHLSLAPDALSLEHARVIQIWEGLGVHQLSLHLERPVGPKAAPRGAIFALTSGSRDEGGGQIKMWSVGALMNLAIWRTTNPDEPPLDLSPPSLARAGSILRSKGTPREQKRASTSGILKSFVNAHAGFTSKGKRPSHSAHSSTSSIESPPELGSSLTKTSSYVAAFDAARSPRLSLDQQGASDHSRQSSDSAASSTEPQKSAQLEWATSSVPITLRSGHAPILFFKLCKAPPLVVAPFVGDYEDHPPRVDLDQWLYLIVVTASKSVFVYESKPAQQRMWTVVNELYSPSTPAFVSLVRTPAQAAPTQSKRHSGGFTSRRSSASETDLALVVGISAGRAVLIHLADLTVVELGLAVTPSSRPRAASGTKLTPASTSASPVATGLGFSFGRKAAGVIARATSVANSFVEGTSGGKLPAGMRGEDTRGMSKGVKLVAERRPSTGAHFEAEEGVAKPLKGDWVACDEIRLPASSIVELKSGLAFGSQARCLYLITKGSSSHLALFPLGLAPETNSRSASAPASASPGGMSGTPAPLVIEPIHSFTWPGPVTRVVAVLRRREELVEELANTHRLVVLMGVHEHGVYVQEGTLSLIAIESLFKPWHASARNEASSSGAVFVRTRARKTSPLKCESLAALRQRLGAGVSQEWEEPRDDSIEVDFGSRVVVLGEGVRKEGESVYLAVEGRAEWQLHVLD